MKLRAAVLESTGAPLTIAELELRGAADTDVIVRIAAASICHTDLEVVDGQLASPLPLVPGHEAAGTVAWVGKAVTRVAVGDPVVLSWNPHCRHCFYCAEDQPILCEPYRRHAAQSFHFDGRPRLFRAGEPVHQLMYVGGFADHAIVGEQCAVVVPRELPLELACLIGCGVMTGVGAVRHIAKLRAGEIATVIGCGAVGLSAIQGARLADAGRIIAVDRDPAKLALARTFGATHTLPADDALLPAHAELTAGRGADAVFEAAGNEAAFRASLELARPGGQVVWLGKVSPNHDIALRWGALTGEKRIVRSSYGGARPQRDFPWLAHAYLDGRLLLDEYVTSRIGLADINTGLARLRQGQDIRAVVSM